MNLRPRARPLLFIAAVVAAACLPGSRAPNVPPQRTLELRGAELSGKGSSAPFGVVFAGPKGIAIDPTEVTIVWNRPMRPLDLAGEEAAPPAKIELAPPTDPPQAGGPRAAAPKGQWRWLGTSALAFMPEKALPRATAYKVTVPGATKALDGSVLGKDYVFEFKTPGPRVAHVTPGDGSTHLKPKQTFEVRFNQPVDPKEVQRATKMVANGKSLAFVVERPKPDVPMLVKLVPTAPLPLASKIVISVDATLKGLEGPLPSGVSSDTHVETYGPMEVGETSCSRTEKKLCMPHGGVFVNLSNRVSYKDFRAHVRVEPVIAMKWAKGRNDDDKIEWMNLPLDLPPATTLKVTITAGLKDEYGQVLAKDHVTSLTTDDESPGVVIGLQGEVLEAAKAKGREIPVAAVNVPSYELVTAVADEDGVMRMRGYHRTPEDRWSALRGLPGAKIEDVKPGGPRNVNAIKNVSIDSLLAAKKGRGVVAVGVSRPNPRPGANARPIRDFTYVSVTDLAITARLSRFGSVVMVTRLSDGKPVPGAIVAARDASGNEAFSVKTDANGLVAIGPDKLHPVNANGAVDENLVLFARSGDDWTYRAAVDTIARAEMPYVDLAARMQTFGMLFTDRGIYKAGETIRLKGVFRKPLPRGMETPAGRNVTLRVYDPDGGKLFESTKPLGAFGEIAADVAIPVTSRLGRLNIEAIAEDEKEHDAYGGHAAYTSVDVAAYRPAEFKTAVEPDKTSYVRGDKASFVTRGDYLFGAPMSGGKIRYAVTRSRSYFSPPNTEKFVTDDEAYSWALPDSSPRGGKIQGGDGVLDAKGTYAASVALALPKQVGPENVNVEAEIEDFSRQTVASSATTLVHPAEFYVALERPKESFPAVGAPLRATVAAVDPAGRRRAGVPVQVELVERTWKTATEAVGEEDLHYESRPVDKVVAQCSATSASGDTAGCELAPPSAGYYVVRAKAKDARGNPVAASYGVYVVGEGARMSWPVYDGARLELVTDKKSYEVGDAATILIKSPFAEAEALVTIERQGVHEQRRVAVKGPMPTIKVPITNELWPNAYVGVQLLKARTAPVKDRGQDVGAPSFRIGYAEINVNPEARRLDVNLKPSKKDLRPGEEVEVDLAVTGRDGKPVKADVAFYAVDEGVLMLTGYKTPDPLPVFAARRALSVAPIESRDDLARIVRLGRAPGVDKGDEGGGGDDGGMTTREDFRTTAFFQPSVITGADGKAKVKFKVPDSLTTFRLMAVASAQDHRFGFGQDQVVTSRPLMARPALPRFLRAGDAIEAGVIVTSKGLAAQKVEVRIAAQGVQVAGDALKTIDLPANGSIEVRWPILAPAAGNASFTFSAKSGAGNDSVTVPREVKVPLGLEAVALYGDTEKAVAEKLGNLASMRTDTGGLDLRVASSALVGLDDSVESLLDYPYGCTEQLTSRLVPLVALVDLAKDYGIKLPLGPPPEGGVSNADRVADEAIAKILKNQRPEGGFGYWQDSEKSDVWVTTYAVWTLATAKEHGRPVPQDRLDSAVKWLRDQIAACGIDQDAKRRRSYCDDADVVLAQQAFIVDVLAMTGQADAGYTGRLYEKRAKMPLFARALLAHAMVTAKLRLEDAKELVRDAENYVRVTPTGATIVENVGDRYAPLLDSENRTTAMVLRTLVTIDPAHPLAARIAKGLLAARRGGSWRSTQENAWALVSLDAYRRAQEAKAPDFDAQVFFGDQEIFTAPFHGRSVKSQSAKFPASKLGSGGGQTLAFQVKGSGRLFYEARLRYAKKELPDTPLDRGFFVRKLVRSLKPEALADAMRTIPQSSSTNANASDLVLVDLLVVTPDPREQVVIDDPLPAGLEPVQSALATTARDLAVTEPGGMGDADDADDARDPDARAMGQTWSRSSYHREFHDDRVLTFVDHMAAGMYHYRYLARATTPGKFIVPPTKAECMYEPETFGRTAAGAFEVKK